MSSSGYGSSSSCLGVLELVTDAVLGLLVAFGLLPSVVAGLLVVACMIVGSGIGVSPVGVSLVQCWVFGAIMCKASTDCLSIFRVIRTVRAGTSQGVQSSYSEDNVKRSKQTRIVEIR